MSRFLVRRDVRCRMLASKALGLYLRRPAADFEARDGVRPLLAETFSGPDFSGTCLAAAGWRWVGASSGRGRLVQRIAEQHRCVPGMQFADGRQTPPQRRMPWRRNRHARGHRLCLQSTRQSGPMSPCSISPVVILPLPLLQRLRFRTALISVRDARPRRPQENILDRDCPFVHFCARLPAVNGREFITRVRRLARRNGTPSGSTGRGARAATAPLYYGDRHTVVKDRRKPLKTGTLRGMCKQLGIDPDDL